jgi:gliding motility-associated-like protein
MVGFGQNLDTSSTTLFIPNAFSPNSDGVNDVFRPAGMGVKEFIMKIYSRRGDEIFYSENIYFGWDGSYNSTIETNEVDFLPSNTINTGVYIYIINVVDLFNKTFTYTGKIRLIN